MFDGLFRNMPILVTGHTGFKGAWLSHMLKSLGARPIGFSLGAEKTSLYTLSGLQGQMDEEFGDIRDIRSLDRVFQKYQPQCVFHLAAQSIVLESYHSPKETFDTNVGGTVNLLELLRHEKCVKAALIVTSDKCYENTSNPNGYKESDRLGGSDPYSASKCMAEHAVASYQSSFDEMLPPVATARAGNVIGGGDFSSNRIVPDILQALASGQTIEVRNPDSVRPWLYVLDVLHGYLTLVQKLLQDGKSYAEPWNFAPTTQDHITVRMLVEEAISQWGSGSWSSVPGKKKEMPLLSLNGEKTAEKLNWYPQCQWKEGLKASIDWHRQYTFDPSTDLIGNIINQQLETYFYAIPTYTS